MIQSFEKITGETIGKWFYDCALYNAGVVGGNYQTVLYFLMLMCKEFFRLNTGIEHDMMILSYIIYKHFHNIPPVTNGMNVSCDVLADKDGHSCSDYVMSGFPLCSEFFKYQYGSEACFIHK